MTLHLCNRCGQPASFNLGADLRKGKEGTWWCGWRNGDVWCKRELRDDKPSD